RDGIAGRGRGRAHLRPGATGSRAMVSRNGGIHPSPPPPTESSPTSSPSKKLPEVAMADMETALKELMTIDGAIGVALVDYNSGMALGVLGGSKDLDLTVAAAGNTDVV